jgi:hypothetical protein
MAVVQMRKPLVKYGSSAGGTLIYGGGNQIHFSIGETFGFADCYYAILTQGFQQPGESIRTGNANSICTGSSFKLHILQLILGS